MENGIGRLIGILVVGFIWSFSHPADAAVFTRCVPDAEAWQYKGDEAAKAEAQKREALRCDTINGVIDSMSAKLAPLNDAKRQIVEAANAGRWDEFRKAWQSTKGPMLELQKDAEANQGALGAGNFRSLFGQDLNYLFQNAGLDTPASLEDAFAKIDEASRSPAKASKAATVAANFVGQTASRGSEMVMGIANAAGDKVQRETKAIFEDQRRVETEKLRGTTAAGYVGGFGKRITSVWSPFLFMLMVVCFLGAWIGIKKKRNPIVSGTAAGLSYLIPGTGMAGSLIFLPFLPQWFVIAATLAGTGAIYFNSGRVFGWLAIKVGYDTPTGRRLRILGGTLDSLRAGLDGQGSAGGVVGDMAASQATHGSARWGTAAEMRQGGHLVAPGKPTGFALARVPDAPAGLDKRFRYMGHVVTVAPTGSGKGIGAVIPNLLDYPGSMLVTDYKGENAAVTARARRALGQAVHVIDPFGVNGADGAAFNVLDRLDTGNPDCVSESAILADALVVTDGKGDNVHFDESAKNLLQGLMLHVAALDDIERRNLGELRRLLTASEGELLDLLGMMAADETAAFGIPARTANTLMGMADRERGSVLSTARRNTAFLDDPRIAAALSRTDFDLSAIKQQAMTVYLVLPANRIAPNARFLRLFISSVISAITASAQQPAHRVAFVLDEFNQLGYMKQIEDAVSLLRGYGLAFWVFLQDLSQLKVYPKWQTFLANSAKTFYGTDDYDTAKYVSDSLGQGTIEYETGNSGQNSGSGMGAGGGSLNRGKSSGSSQQFTGRHLLTPDEVMRLGPEKPIILLKGEYPYLAVRLNYLVDAEYQGMADPNPYHS